MASYVAFVYKWTDHLTGMYYIGVRKGKVEGKYITSSKIFNPIYKERPSDFTREILSYWSDFEDAHNEEIRLLTEVNATCNPLYYNRHNGGVKFHNEGNKHSEESKQKMRRPKSEETRKKLSESLKGNIPWNKGKIGLQPHSPETIEKMKGKIPWNKGIPMENEQKEKLRQANLGKRSSQETIEKLSGRIPWNKGIPMTEESKQKMILTKLISKLLKLSENS